MSKRKRARGRRKLPHSWARTTEEGARKKAIALRFWDSHLHTVIARRLGIKTTTIHSWGRRAGLPPQKRGGHGKRRIAE